MQAVELNAIMIKIEAIIGSCAWSDTPNCSFWQAAARQSPQSLDS